jgi:hypothetical protein
MRLVFGIGSGLLMIFAVLIAGARQIGHRQERDHFPLPSADGCWQGLCFLEMSEEEIVQALAHHPDVAEFGGVRNSIHYVFKVDYSHKPLASVILYASPEDYVFARDYQSSYSSLMMSAGDVLVKLGPPQKITLTNSYDISLNYSNLDIIIDATMARPYPARVLPNNIVREITVYNPNFQHYGRLTWDPVTWHGFGTYDFRR